MRKVSNKTNSGGTIQLQTTDASLEDLFKQAEIHYNKDITPSDTVGRIASNEFKINLINEVLYDADGNNATTYDQLKGSGSIVFEIKDFSFEYIRPEGSTIPTKVEVKTQVLEKSGLTYTFGGSITIPNKILKYIKSYEIQPIRIVVPIMGVPVPIIIKNKLKISPSFILDGKFELDFTDNTLYTIGAKYESGSWSSINISAPAGNSTKPLKSKFKWKVNSELMVNVEIESKPYGSDFLKSTIGCDYGLKMYVDTTQNPDYKLNLGGQFKAGIKSTFFGNNLFDYNYIYDFPEVLFLQGNFNDSLAWLTNDSSKVWKLTSCPGNPCTINETVTYFINGTSQTISGFNTVNCNYNFGETWTLNDFNAHGGSSRYRLDQLSATKIIWTDIDPTSSMYNVVYTYTPQ